MEQTQEIDQRRQEMTALYRADEELYRPLQADDVLQALVDIVCQREGCADCLLRRQEKTL